VKIRRLAPRALEKVWGTEAAEPWYPRSPGATGEVWFTAEEEPRLLVKFAFISGKLSVQVHPPDSAEGPGKTALSGEMEGLLRWYRRQAGDTFFVPAARAWCCARSNRTAM
jgi:mannose-6-phosphate isomerase class I